MPNDISSSTDNFVEYDQTLAESIFNFVRDNNLVTRHKINIFYSRHNDEKISQTINLLLEKSAIEYCPLGIKLGPKPYFTSQVTELEKSIKIYNCSKLESIESMDCRIEKYLKSSNYYNPHDEIAKAINSLSDCQKKDILTKIFFGNDEVFETILGDKRYKVIISRFCECFDCDTEDINLFTRYFLPSNLFLYVFNRPISYYRMMCLKYEQGEISPELMLNYADNESASMSIGVSKHAYLLNRIKNFTEGYADYCGIDKYASFIEFYLFLMNDYSIGVESLDYLAYKMHGLKPDLISNHPVDPIFDRFITTYRSVKYISSDNIHSILNELESIYSERAVTPEKIFKDNQKFLLMYYIEDLSELKQIISKYGSYAEMRGYVCFNTDLEKAISDFAIETDIYDWSKISKSFIKKYGGDAYIIADFAKVVELKSKEITIKKLNDIQFNELHKGLENYQWISVDNAKDVFEYKCDCAYLFNNYNMHSLGFNIDGDAYYRTSYQNLKNCLRKTTFSSDDLFIDQKFKVSMECISFKREVDYLITNLMWIPVSDNRYVNLRSDKYNALYRAVKRCKPLLESRCQNEYMTAYKLKKSGTGIEFIDNDDFEIVFYDALLMSTHANRNIILKQRAYHYGDGDSFGTSNFIKYIVKAEGGESSTISIKNILESEYGFHVTETYVRQLVTQSGCIYIKEMDAVYENKESYMEAKQKWKMQ